MSALFKRNDKTTIAELEEYYANQNKRRSGTAWLMAFLSLLITIAIIVALFFAGRWIYRAIFDNNDASETGTSETSEGTQTDLPTFDSEGNEIGGDRGVGFEEGTSNNPDDLIVEEGSGEAGSEGTVSDEAASTDEPNADRIAAGAGDSTGGDNTSDVASSTDTNDEELPDTGPGESILAVLIAVTILGYLGSRKFYANK